LEQAYLKIFRLAWDFPEDGNPVYGLQPVYYYLSREQARLNHEVHVITNRRSYQPKKQSLDGTEIHRVDSPFNLNALSLLAKLIDRKERPIIHTHATCGVFLAPTKKLIKVPVVAQVHGTTISHYTPLGLIDGKNGKGNSRLKLRYYYMREKLLWSSADRIATVSRFINEALTLRYGISAEKIRVVYNGVDTDIFKPTENVEPTDQLRRTVGKKVVLYVGHF
jgi:glycosyltransferase involved in cell wall biosynthesis